jgi:hypothetical protein
MKWPRSSLDRATRVGAYSILCLMVMLAGSAAAIDKEPVDPFESGEYSMVGIRLGAWIDNGGGQMVEDITVDADMPDAGFYTELFFDYRLTPIFLIESSLGIASRGDAVISYENDRYIGTINLYQLMIQIKISPLSGKLRSFHPFFLGGGGLVWGRQSIDIITSEDLFYNPDIANKTETDILGVFGAGIDFPIAEQVGMNVTVKYHPITFGDALAGVKDYSGTAVSVGVAYFLY